MVCRCISRMRDKLCCTSIPITMVLCSNFCFKVSFVAFAVFWPTITDLLEVERASVVVLQHHKGIISCADMSDFVPGHTFLLSAAYSDCALSSVYVSYAVTYFISLLVCRYVSYGWLLCQYVSVWANLFIVLPCCSSITTRMHLDWFCVIKAHFESLSNCCWLSASVNVWSAYVIWHCEWWRLVFMMHKICCSYALKQWTDLHTFSVITTLSWVNEDDSVCILFSVVM